MDDKLAASLLEKAMLSPDVVDDLWYAKHGTPEDRHGLGGIKCYFRISIDVSE